MKIPRPRKNGAAYFIRKPRAGCPGRYNGGRITEHAMRFLSWKTVCAAAALSAPFLALAQQPSDYAREKRWAAEVVPSVVVGEVVWLEAPRTEKVLGIYTAAQNSNGTVAPLKGVKFPVYDVSAEKDYDVVLQGAEKRAALLKRMRGSSQTMMFATDHFFAKREKELVALVRLLLEGEKK